MLHLHSCGGRLGPGHDGLRRGRARAVITTRAALASDQTARVRGDINRVYQYLANLEYAPQWRPGTVAAQKLGSRDDPVVPGSKFRVQEKLPVVGRVDVTYQLVDMEPNRRVVFSGISPMHTCQDHFIFMQDRNDTEYTIVRHVGDLRLREWRSFLEPLLGKVLGHSHDAALCSLAATLQAPTSPIYTPEFEAEHGLRGTRSTRNRGGSSSGSGPRWSFDDFFNRGGSSSGTRSTRTTSSSGGSGPRGSRSGGASVAERIDPDAMGYYRELGLQPGPAATDAHVRTAFRKAAMLYHPDRQLAADDRTRAAAAQKFARLTAAYETLRDPEKRVLYDAGRWLAEEVNS